MRSAVQFAVHALALLTISAGALFAQQSVPFTIIGDLQTFTLDAGCSNSLCPATMKVNGITIRIPANTLIAFPARYLTPNDVFRFKTNDHPVASPGDPVQPASGLALEDPAAFKPLAAYEVQITGNLSGAGPNAMYIAGLVKIWQQSLNTSDGYILSIDNAREEMMVGPEGGALNNKSAVRVQLNDPRITDRSSPSHPAGSGRFGVGASPDARFAADQENATIRSATGYPMCIPRSAGGDPECPAVNRPGGTRFTMGPVDAMAKLPAGPGVFPAPSCSQCQPSKQAPLRVGDRVTFAGTLSKDARGTFISAHTVTAWVAIYTQPGVDPAYLSIEDSRIGTGGIPFPAIDQETGPARLLPGALASTRIRVEAMVTDLSRSVAIYALDYNGAPDPVERPLSIPGFARARTTGGIKPPAGLMTMNPTSTPPFGRVRLIVDRANYLPVPREVRVRYVRAAATRSKANGVWSGQYSAPVTEYFFPENLNFGQRPVPANFENLCFLFRGTGPLTTLGRGTPGVPLGGFVGKLNPWPESGHPTPQVPCP